MAPPARSEIARRIFFALRGGCAGPHSRRRQLHKPHIQTNRFASSWASHLAVAPTSSPRVGRQDVGGSRSDDRRRESCRRVGHDRGSRGRAFCPRWLHAVNGSFELECDRHRVGQSSLRRSGGLHADYVCRLRAERARRSSGRSGTHGSRVDRAREGQAGYVHVRRRALAARSIWPAHCSPS